MSLPRWSRLPLAALAFCACAAALLVLIPLYRSLPDRSGRFIFPTLSETCAIQRDNLGTLRISAATRRDASKLLGFAHAQDRFFQMDLMRRLAAGEVAELFGPAALPLDRQNRRHRLRAVAHAALLALPEPQREMVEDYTIGVNLGLRELEAPPFEYVLLRTAPDRWRAEDSLLVVAAMALSLQRSDGEPELSRAVVADVFDRDTAAFLLSAAEEHQSAVDGSLLPPPALPATPGFSAEFAPLAAAPAAGAPQPAPAGDLRARLFAAWAGNLQRAAGEGVGSNAFAVRGKRGERVVALLANDMHLQLSLPRIWYRTEIAWRLDPRHNRTVDGITLPGLPMLVAGSNGQVAWGFTNSYADTCDLVVLELDPANARRYRTPEGWREFEHCAEKIAVNGAAEETLAFDTTIWGPVLGRDHRGRLLALKWAMGDAAAYDLQWSALENVGSVRAALAFGKNSGGPQLNLVAADRDGDIGWTVAGHLPRRVGFDGSTPVSWADGTAHWDGWQPLHRHPAIINPPSGKLWSANNRMVGGEDLAVLGDGGYLPGARAFRIHERLAQLETVNTASLFDIMLDVRGLYLDRWQQLLVATLDSAAITGQAGRTDLKALAQTWGGEAVPDSAGYRLVHDFRAAVMQRIDVAVFERCRAVFPSFDASVLPLDRIAFTLASAQPAGWLPKGTESWRALLLAAADEVVIGAGGAGRLDRHTWGQANRLAMRHPLSAAMPALGFFLDMPADELPGDPLVVRAQTPSFGASVRMAIQPGWEQGSLIALPGGQCANPLSPYYSDGHAEWADGEALPLQPGKVADHQVNAPPAP